MHAGSITFSTALDNAQLEKDLAGLTRKIEKQERKIASITTKRDEARKKSSILGASIEEEHKKLDKLKSKIQEIQSAVKDKTLSPDVRAEAAADLPQAKEAYKEQQQRVRMLESEFNKLENSADRYTEQLKEAESTLGRQKEEAGELVRQIEEVGGSEISSNRIEEIFGRMREYFDSPVQSTKALFEEFFQSVSNGFTGISQTISESAKKIPGYFKNAFSRATKTLKSGIAAVSKRMLSLTKNMSLFSKTSGSIGKSLKRLGQMMKRVFVFSVITAGLRAIRTQMSAYLGVNTQFSSALQQLKGVLLTAFQPIYDVVVPALTTLMNVLSRAIAAISQFTSVLFGTTAKQAQKNAQALYNQAKATEAAGSAAEEAAGSLAGFDEINTIQTEKQAGGGGGAVDESGPLFDWEYEDMPFPDWGEAFDAFISKMLRNIPKLRDAFKSFANWLNGLSKKLYDMFTFPGVLDKVKQLGKDLAVAFNDLVKWINWYQLGQALGAGLNLALMFLVNFIYTFDWINLGQSLAALVNGAVSEIDWLAVGQLLWAGFKIAIETLAGFLLGLDMPQMAEAASNLVIGFFDSMKETLDNIDWEQIGEQVRTFLTNIDWLGIMKSVSEAISSALSSASDFFTGVLGKEVKEQIRDILVTVSKATLALGAILALSGVNIPLGLSLLKIGAVSLAAAAVLDWDYMKSNIKKIIGEILAIAGASLLALGLILCLTGVNLPLGIALVAAGAVGLVTAAALNWNAIKEKLSSMWDSIKSWWGSSDGPGKYLTLDYWKNLGKDMIDGLLKGLEGIFSGLRKWASDVWSSITGAFSQNNAKASVSNSASNSASGGGRSSNGVSVGRLSVQSMPDISNYRVPALAQGAVIPPNREFMAVLGDQGHGNNLEAPEDLIRKIVREESGGGNAELAPLLQSILQAIKDGHIIMVDGTVFGRTAIRTINSANTAAGKQLLLI